MLPDRCSIREGGRPCVNPPEFVMSILSKDGEYMIGVTCENHKNVFSDKMQVLQEEGKLPQGQINFTALKAVGTDCIKAHPDDLINIE
ncbi:MAG: hypothetical protein QXY22_04740 [Candidatus Nitrosotenuis sp.]|uniref:Uncharacterized protein n=1 Tax=Candidatus Nitrosotenuis uzonensis TaxID=1407055 RepID=V6AR94_9ARCH|nr:hypothetical protein [Candidatus Nitrosotenuis uzonensis]CDI05251.1 conserved hypothetical protein [Candidatus Nitrosotenuis uzonensis]